MAVMKITNLTENHIEFPMYKEVYKKKTIDLAPGESFTFDENEFADTYGHVNALSGKGSLEVVYVLPNGGITGTK